jgi:hypothetical protein
MELDSGQRQELSETYKAVVKLTFAKGASLPDPAHLFNASLDGSMRRAIDLHEGDTIDESAFKTLISRAAALNGAKKSKPAQKPVARRTEPVKDTSH